MNNVSLLGRLTKNPELKTTQSGLSVCRFTVAVDRPYSKEQTDFINCIAWRQTAEFVSYFSKGQRIALAGSIQTGSYTDNDGKTVYTTDVNVNNVEFCESKKQNNSESSNSNNNHNSGETDDMPFDDDLPF